MYLRWSIPLAWTLRRFTANLVVFDWSPGIADELFELQVPQDLPLHLIPHMKEADPAAFDVLANISELRGVDPSHNPIFQFLINR